MRSDEGRVHTVVGLGRNLDCDNVRQKDKYLTNGLNILPVNGCSYHKTGFAFRVQRLWGTRDIVLKYSYE